MSASTGSYSHRVVDADRFLAKSGQTISPFHDIPLWVDRSKGLVNQIIEIPCGQNAKLEISKDEEFNPIKQDVKKGKLRYVAMKYPFNYGAFPQTWENCFEIHDMDCYGDNDPLDVVNISPGQYNVGDIVPVKILGVYAMIDDSEADWKIIVASLDDPHIDELNDAEDIRKVYPGKVESIFNFLRDYKIPDGNPPNTFGYDNQLLNRAKAIEIVEKTYNSWCDLVHGKITNEKLVINLKNACVSTSPFCVGGSSCTATQN